jgi:hypothetical protein
MRTLEYLHNSDTMFSAECHVYAHRVGEEGYLQFRRGRRFPITDKTSLCNLGFYHGFMQELTSHNADRSEAVEFCEYVRSNAPKDELFNTETLISQCYHGLGHGLTFSYAQQYWGKELAMIDTGITECGKIQTEYRECVNGVFGGMVAMYFGLHGFLLPYHANDPFWICANRETFYAILCYDSMVPVVYGQNNLSVPATGKFVLAIRDREARRVAMEHLGTMPSHTLVPKTENFSGMLADCRSFPPDMATACLRGFAKSLVYIGPAGEAMKRALGFCTGVGLSPQEQDICTGALVEQVTYMYTPAGVAKLCADLGEERGWFCERIERT